MTICQFGSDRPNGRPLRYARLAGVGLLLFSVGGCFMPALTLAPLALHATEAIGAAVINAATAQADDSGPDSDADDRCDELELEVPGTIELRVDDHGPAAWRDLALAGSTDAPRWQAVVNEHSDAAGWRPIRNLQTMNFVPPLHDSLKPGSANYLAYAPAGPRSEVEQGELTALTTDFGAGQGTFQWKGRTYQYTLVNKLPCFPATLPR